MNDDIIMMPVPRSQFVAVCALLGGVSRAALVAGDKPQTVISSTRGSTADLAEAAEIPGVKSQTGEAPAAAAETVGTVADGTLDAAGWPWDASLHASTRGTTKDGLWRMKVGVSRPDPKPGFPKDAPSTGGTGTSTAGTAPESSATAGSLPAGEDEDEFAAFRAAADKANGTDAAAAAAVPARKWTDTDLGALCNQAAVKLGDPAPVKAVIAEFVPEGTVPHSRNILADDREAFAQALELKAGIEFAG